MPMLSWASLLAGLVVRLAAAGPVNDTVHAELSRSSGWRESHRDGQVQVYSKHLKTVDHTAWMGVVVLPAEVPALRLFQVIGDTERHPSFNNALAESVVVSTEADVTTFYQVLDPPAYAPLSDRWWVCRSINARDVDGTPGHLRRKWSSVPPGESADLKARLQARYPGAVEVPYSHGQWDLIPQADGTTRVIYRVVSDPGGSIPRGLSTRFAGRSVADNIRNMVNEASR